MILWCEDAADVDGRGVRVCVGVEMSAVTFPICESPTMPTLTTTFFLLFVFRVEICFDMAESDAEEGWDQSETEGKGGSDQGSDRQSGGSRW